MRDALAEKSKYDISYDQRKQQNIILQMTIKELKRKMNFLCALDENRDHICQL